MNRVSFPFVFMTLLLVGCSSESVGKRPEPVEVTVKLVLANGSPASNVSLTAFPTSVDQMQGGGSADGAGIVKARLMPGEHTFAVETKPDSKVAIPEKFRSNDAANKFEVPSSGGEVTIKLAS